MHNKPIVYDFEKSWQLKRQQADYYFISYRAKWFDHCFVFMVYPGGGLRIESLWAKLDIEPYTEVQAVAALELFIAAGWNVEKIPATTLPPRRLPGLGTCVSICKRVLGIDKPWIITARQLARWINEQMDKVS